MIKRYLIVLIILMTPLLIAKDTNVSSSTSNSLKATVNIWDSKNIWIKRAQS